MISDESTLITKAGYTYKIRYAHKVGIDIVRLKCQMYNETFNVWEWCEISPSIVQAINFTEI